MCEPVGQLDSRGCGYYCCQCNRWVKKLPCCIVHRKTKKRSRSEKNARAEGKR